MLNQIITAVLSPDKMQKSVEDLLQVKFSLTVTDVLKQVLDKNSSHDFS